MDKHDRKENLSDLKMAKKRDHKIMITDEAIKKVPRIQYKNKRLKRLAESSRLFPEELLYGRY